MNNIPRELVIKTLEFASPCRIPRIMNVQPWAIKHYSETVRRIQEKFPDDIVGAMGFCKQPPKRVGSPYNIGKYIDEWGCVFENRYEGIIGEVKAPLIQTWKDVDKVRFPNEMLDVDADRINSYCCSTDKFVIGGCIPRPFERMQYLRGSENVFMDIAARSAEFMELLNKVHQFYLKEFEIWAQTGVNGLLFADDWGSQNNLLIAPQRWREIFKPFYQEYVSVAHNYGKYVAMHCCGNVLEIIPDMIEIGIDMINCQVFCMGVEKLGKLFKGKITFWGEIDRQNILPHGTTRDIRDAVNFVSKSLYAEGGLIANCEFGPGAKPENVYTVFEAWEKWSPE